MRKKGNFSDKLMGVIRTHWLLLLAVILALPLIIGYLKKAIDSLRIMFARQNAETAQELAEVANQNPEVQESNADAITPRKDLQQAAASVAADLGSMYMKSDWFWWLNPKTWSENDKAVADTLLKYASNYSVIKRLYYSVYAPGRNLQEDLLNWLDKDELKRVQTKISI